MTADFFEKNKINWLKGKTVNKLDTANKKVIQEDGKEIGYDKLLIATGAESFIPPVGKSAGGKQRIWSSSFKRCSGD